MLNTLDLELRNNCKNILILNLSRPTNKKQMACTDFYKKLLKIKKGNWETQFFKTLRVASLLHYSTKHNKTLGGLENVCHAFVDDFSHHTLPSIVTKCQTTLQMWRHTTPLPPHFNQYQFLCSESVILKKKKTFSWVVSPS